MLGIAEADRIPLRDRVDAMVALNPMTPDGAEARAKLQEHVLGLAAAKRADPGADLLSALIAARADDGDRFSEPELATMAIALLIAGYATTANAIAIGTTLLLTKRSIRRAGPRSGTGGAGRRGSLVTQTGRNAEAMPRIAHADVRLRGVDIAVGEQVLVSLEAANRDPGRFPEPDRFGITRHPNPHLSFGRGPHHCLGAALGGTGAQRTPGRLHRALSHPSAGHSGRRTAVAGGPDGCGPGADAGDLVIGFRIRRGGRTRSGCPRSCGASRRSPRRR
ncbi:cytochrome P450 [Saccharopolyspora sp. NPDC050389]|uniref:cytochrome P450 n=1 Tax=Saccharopolyspora sp. NPDC050389 TaxID=3155516 RepID=UPI0033F83BD9